MFLNWIIYYTDYFYESLNLLFLHTLVTHTIHESTKPGISWTLPELLLLSLLPSLSLWRLLYRQPDELSWLGELAKTPEGNIIKLPNISASVPQVYKCCEKLARGRIHTLQFIYRMWPEYFGDNNRTSGVPVSEYVTLLLLYVPYSVRRTWSDSYENLGLPPILLTSELCWYRLHWDKSPYRLNLYRENLFKSWGDLEWNKMLFSLKLHKHNNYTSLWMNKNKSYMECKSSSFYHLIFVNFGLDL